MPYFDSNCHSNAENESKIKSMCTDIHDARSAQGH